MTQETKRNDMNRRKSDMKVVASELTVKPDKELEESVKEDLQTTSEKSVAETLSDSKQEEEDDGSSDS